MVNNNNKVTEGLFVKMQLNTFHSGLAAALGSDLWITLSALASFIDKKGVCFPAQDTLAHRMGVSRTTANGRVKKLLAFHWEGKPIVTARKERGEGGRFDKTIYTLTPESGFTIFSTEDNSDHVKVTV
jgi:hypothetical protein